MNATKLQIGAPIDSWCTGCKTDQPHVVATLKTDGTLNKVSCKSCNAVHVYRKPKTAAKSDEGRPSGSKKRKSDGTVTEAEQSRAKPYAMDGTFAAGDVIGHSKFGFGRVVALKPGGKMEVAFPDGSRILVCRDVGLLTAKRPARPAPVVVAPKPVAEDAADDDAEEAETDDATAEDE